MSLTREYIEKAFDEIKENSSECDNFSLFYHSCAEERVGVLTQFDSPTDHMRAIACMALSLASNATENTDGLELKDAIDTIIEGLAGLMRMESTH